jgi:GNAT superfamily N-acetyltransferase
VSDDPALARRLEEAGLNNMHTRRQLLYDGWLLFLSPGKAKRGRSVNACFGSTLPLARKIAHCEAVYARHGLPLLFRVTPFAQPSGLDDALAAHGYVAFDETLVQSLALEAPPATAASPDLTLESPLPEAFVEAVGDMRGSPPAQRAAHLERIAQSPLDVTPVIAKRCGEVVGSGMVSIEDDIAGLFDIVVTPAQRRRGIGSAITAALLVRAWERGARHAYLQVTAANGPAVAIYRRLGFATRYAYHYRAREEPVE